MSRCPSDRQESQLPTSEMKAEFTGERAVPSLEALANVLVSRDLSELEYEQDGVRIYLSRKRDIVEAPIRSVVANVPANSTVVTSTSSTPTPESSEATPIDWSQHPGAVHSPMVGVAYVAPEPGAAPFVRIGDEVKAGQTLLIIEAMKVLNPIKAPKGGRVVEILIHDQEPVEYDEVLVVIE